MFALRWARFLCAAALLGSCSGTSADSGVLEPADEPLRDAAPYELGQSDSCRWLEDGRLFVEIVWGEGTIRGVERMWIAFQPPAAPRVQVLSWNEELGTTSRWDRKRIRGRSWVSSDGDGLGAPDGPELTIDTHWTCWISGSDQQCGRRLLLRTEDLARER